MTPGALAEINFTDRDLLCVECGETFVWSAGSQQFFFDKGLTNDPKRCERCKQAKNQRMEAAKRLAETGVKQRITVEVKCAECGIETTVPFYPSRGQPVYCRKCFLARRA